MRICIKHGSNEVTMEPLQMIYRADSLDVFQIVMGIMKNLISNRKRKTKHIVSVEDAVEEIKKKLAE